MKTIVLICGFLAASGMLSRAGAICPTAVTLAGNNANNALDGTDGADRIVGNGGNDVIRGFGGTDCINGGSQNDILDGGPDDDNIAGEGGNDVIFGGAGNDHLNGGSNDDVIAGGEGDDQIAGEGGDDIIIGGPGADRINGGSGRDTIIIMAGDVPAGRIEDIDGAGDVDTLKANFLVTLTPPLTIVTDPVTGGRYRIRNVETVVLMPTTVTSTTTPTTTSTSTTTLPQCGAGLPDASDVCGGACPAGQECATVYDVDTLSAGCACVPAPACRQATSGNCPLGARCTHSNLSASKVCGELLCCTNGLLCGEALFNGSTISCNGSAFSGAVCNASAQCCDDGGGACH